MKFSFQVGVIVVYFHVNIVLFLMLLLPLQCHEHYSSVMQENNFLFKLQSDEFFARVV